VNPVKSQKNMLQTFRFLLLVAMYQKKSESTVYRVEAVFTKSMKKQLLQIRRGVRKRVSREAHPIAMRASCTEW